MEELLHYVWKHKLFPLGNMITTDGDSVEVIDPGLHNTNAGPDFFNAKIRINNTLWVGNIEIHHRSSDWYRHGHDNDAHYNNVILHIVQIIDKDIYTADGQKLPQVQLQIPPDIEQRYAELKQQDKYPPCYHIIPSLSHLTVHSWMSALQTERLESKTKAIIGRLERCNGSWEDAYFITLARNYGFGINGDAFEAWAHNISLSDVAHHRDDVFQTEAIFFGQAGLLDPDSIPERYRQNALHDDYFCKLQGEYRYLARKFHLQPIDFHLWNFLRLRPQNFPHIRLSQLSQLYCSRKAGLSQILECTTIEQLEKAMRTAVTTYWQTHYIFGSEAPKSKKNISPVSIHLLIINTVIPLLFAYGKYKGADTFCDRAFDLLEKINAESNHIVRMWRECGLQVENAGDSQALIQLKNIYCDRHDCLRCRFGYEYLKSR